MLFRFCLYGFLKNQRYFEPFLMLIFLDHGMSFFVIGLLLACRDLTVNLLEIPSGAIADSFGRRGAMVTSFVAYIISFLMLGSASIFGSASTLAMFFVGMILYGIGDTFRTGTHKSMIFEWLRLQGREDERTGIYGFTRSWSQIGSALSGLIAAAFVLVSGSYAYVFYFAIVPYLLNLVNLATYPAKLDGDHEKAKSAGESLQRLKATFLKSVGSPGLRRLMVESMGWEGFFNAAKDYLQPVLQSVAIVGMASFAFQASNDGSAPGSILPASFNEAQRTALIIGPVYAILFLLSAWASRNSQRLVQKFGDEENATRNLWLANLVVFVLIGVAAWFRLNVILVSAFVMLYILKNFWRPILITRFDSQSNPAEGATVLSIESQSQRLATMFFAPLLGWLIDWASTDEASREFWPIGVFGALIAFAAFASYGWTNRKAG